MLTLLLACAQLGADIPATSSDSECVRYYDALVDCATSAGLQDDTDAEAECAGADELDWTCMANFVETSDCSDQNGYADAVNGVWDACPSL